ncbi:MAG: GNAT family N-acetyltransferase [Sulfurimonas sp.]|nr:GNAT family N-acetyltransferase [Sulfurimonas sp.]
MFIVKDVFYKKFPNLVETLPPALTGFLVHSLEKLFHEKKFEEIYKKNHHLSGLQFVDSMLEHLNITYTVKPNELQNVPATGRLLVVANHITGASDAFSLVQLIANVRENKKVRLLVNGMLMGVTQASDIIIPVDNITGVISKKSLLTINEALENGEVVVIFPAGIVNRLSFHGLKDTQWKSSFLKIALRTQTSILPVRIQSRNSVLFYLLSMVFPNKLTALMLPHEFATAGKMKPLHMNIGKVIPVKSFANRNLSIKESLELFYKHLYTLGTTQYELLETETTISQPSNKKLLKEEVKKAKYLGTTVDGQQILLADAQHSPFLLRELGRVREISFRAIGGGTGNSQDNDLYDNYYRHLLLWDEEYLEIVGAYRIGECQDIIADKGKKGLYTYNLCNFNEHFEDYCDSSIELGRSFIQPKYWGSRALDNLWQGVGAYLAHNPKIRYTYGIVTINANTPQKAVAALVYFYSHHFSCTTNMMKAKTPYVLSNADHAELHQIFEHLDYKEGFIRLKRYLKELGTTVPTLFKQYTELYEEGAVRFFDFSVNESLFCVVEGFIIADNSKMKEAKKARYIKNFEI